MFDDIATHFHESVIVAYEDYLAARRFPTSGRSRDLKLGLIAATAAYHFREHLRPPNAIDRSLVLNRCPEYGLLGDVVNASKHGELTRGNPQLRSTQDIEEVVVITELADEAGVYRYAEKIVEVALADGTRCRLHDILRTVVNFWIIELSARGLINARSKYFEEPFVAPTRSECGASEDGAARLDFEIVQGLRFKQTMRLMRYQCTVEISHIDNETGGVSRRSLTLSIEESTRLSRCGSEAEKQSLLSTFETVQKARDEMIEEIASDASQSQDQGTGTEAGREGGPGKT